jgi:hypothetical protein
VCPYCETPVELRTSEITDSWEAQPRERRRARES